MGRFNTIRAKQMAAFLAIASITAIVSLVSYHGMKNLEAKFRIVIESAPLIESAVNMKFTVSRDIMGAMKLMAAKGVTDSSQDVSRNVLKLTDFAASLHQVVSRFKL